MDRVFPRKSALILSHPGHELRVLGWLRAMKPIVFVLTDGAGHGTRPRIELTRKLVEQAGATPAELFGRWSDQRIYQAMLDRDADFFLAIAQEISEVLIREGCELVAGDSIEGYNPSHDLCRHLIQKVVSLLPPEQQRSIMNLEFPLAGHPAVWSTREGSSCLRLTEEKRQQKQADILAYAHSVGGMLLGEVHAALQQFGSEVLSEEWLSPVQEGDLSSRFFSQPPHFETHGRQQVQAGHYRQVIRYREHLLPLCQALRERRVA